MKRAELFALANKGEEVDVPGLGSFQVRPVHMDRFVEIVQDAQDTDGLAGQIEVGKTFVVECLYDEAGEKVFEDVEQVAQVPAPVFQRLLKAVQGVLGVDSEEENANHPDIKQAEKN